MNYETQYRHRDSRLWEKWSDSSSLKKAKKHATILRSSHGHAYAFRIVRVTRKVVKG